MFTCTAVVQIKLNKIILDVRTSSCPRLFPVLLIPSGVNLNCARRGLRWTSELCYDLFTSSSFRLCTGDALLKCFWCQRKKNNSSETVRNNLRIFQWLGCIISKGNCFCAKSFPKVLLIQDVNWRVWISTFTTASVSHATVQLHTCKYQTDNKDTVTSLWF